MPQLKNNKHELFAQYCLIYNRGEAYMKAGYQCDPKYASQNAYNLLKNNQNIKDRISELEEIAREDAKNEVNNYIKLFDDIAFARGEFSGSNKAKIDQRLSAATKAMKAQGIEGDTNVKLKGDCVGFQLIMHSKPKEEEDKEDGEQN